MAGNLLNHLVLATPATIVDSQSRGDISQNEFKRIETKQTENMQTMGEKLGINKTDHSHKSSAACSCRYQ